MAGNSSIIALFPLQSGAASFGDRQAERCRMNASLGAKLGRFSAAVQAINNVSRPCDFRLDLLGIGKTRIVQLVISHCPLAPQTVQQMPCINRNRIAAIL